LYDSPGGGWYMDALQGNYSHWLPHHALPLPNPLGCRTGTHPV
jgi:hypothetical protein